ncbi:MAG: NADH-quinone oxidoreductase subunit D [Actinobacteria bacterium]|nr:NADH-quinone oxidoreductase subunit D [Actinomycetota bacterium]
MLGELYNRTYSSPKLLFMEKMERNVHIYIEQEVSRVFKAGREILLEIEGRNLSSALHAFKNIADFDLKGLGGISFFKNKYGPQMLINFTGSNPGFSLFVKTGLDRNNIREDYIKKVKEISHFYPAADFYLWNIDSVNAGDWDAVIYSQTLEGFDGFDLYLNLEDGLIKKLWVDNEISRVLDIEFLRHINISEAITCISRFDWQAGVFPEIALCRAFEEYMQLKIPRRADYIRVLLCELFRIANHLGFITGMAHIMGFDTAYSSSFLEKEKVLRIIEIITGSRYFPNFMCIGGIKKDISNEVAGRLKKQIPEIYRNILDIEKILMDDFTLIERLKDTGIIERDEALHYGLSGPNIRASGCRNDLRKDDDFISYGDFSFTVPVGRTGDCFNRLVVRFAEIYQSLKILSQVTGKLPVGEILKKINPAHVDLGRTTLISSIECPHGNIKVYTEVEGNMVDAICVMGPSKNSLSGIGEILRGARFEDVDLIIGSLDISPGELISNSHG